MYDMAKYYSVSINVFVNVQFNVNEFIYTVWKDTLSYKVTCKHHVKQP